MIYSIFPNHTATAYQRYPDMNTSKDEILELNKNTVMTRLFRARNQLKDSFTQTDTILKGVK